jgi:hypothetical protein
MLQYPNNVVNETPIHIHFVFYKRNRDFKVSDYKNKRGRLRNDFFEKFDDEKKQSCFNYMLKIGNYVDDSQELVEYGEIFS